MSRQPTPASPLFITTVKKTAHTAPCLLRLRADRRQVVKPSPFTSAMISNNLYGLRPHPFFYFFIFSTVLSLLHTRFFTHTLQVFLLFDSLLARWAPKSISVLKSRKSCCRIAPLTQFFQIMVFSIKHLFLKDRKFHQGIENEDENTQENLFKMNFILHGQSLTQLENLFL